jgi:hypothetical protein
MKQRPSEIRDELHRLVHRHRGELRPEQVVEAAKSKDSPLHASFEWDDTEAAQQYRLDQARNLIRAVVTYEDNGKGKALPCRVFVSLTTDRTKGGAGYRLTTDVLSDTERRMQMLADAKAEMQRFREKYRALSELADVFAAMEQAEDVETQTPASLQATA